jgi:hypothetical protein
MCVFDNGNEDFTWRCCQILFFVFFFWCTSKNISSSVQHLSFPLIYLPHSTLQHNTDTAIVPSDLFYPLLSPFKFIWNIILPTDQTVLKLLEEVFFKNSQKHHSCQACNHSIANSAFDCLEVKILNFPCQFSKISLKLISFSLPQWRFKLHLYPPGGIVNSAYKSHFNMQCLALVSHVF